MSKSAATSVSHPLKEGISLGLSFKEDNKRFWCSAQNEDGFKYIGFMENRDPFICQFFVENLDSGKVHIKDGRGFYLRRTDRNGRFPIEAKQMTPDKSCEFKLFSRNGNVIFKGDNGLFLSRINSGLYGGVDTLEAAKEEADGCCEFLAEGLVHTLKILKQGGNEEGCSEHITEQLRKSRLNQDAV